MRLPQGVQRRSGGLFHRPYWVWLATVPRWEERELITAAVSLANLASFCVASHRPNAVDALSEEQVGQALDDPERGRLAPPRRALLQFAEQLTLTPGEICPAEIGSMIEAGTSIDRLREVVEITAQTDMMNRLTAALGATAGNVEPRAPQTGSR